MIRLIALGVAAVLTVASALAAGAANEVRTPTTTDEARKLTFKLPQTAEAHAALARSYEEKAAAWRTEAELHREMAAAYKASHPDLKAGIRNPEAVRMEKHCMAIVEDAEKLAADAKWSARYHEARAKELSAQAR
jgi:hypothetical protein